MYTHGSITQSVLVFPISALARALDSEHVYGGVDVHGIWVLGYKVIIKTSMSLFLSSHTHSLYVKSNHEAPESTMLCEYYLLHQSEYVNFARRLVSKGTRARASGPTALVSLLDLVSSFRPRRPKNRNTTTSSPLRSQAHRSVSSPLLLPEQLQPLLYLISGPHNGCTSGSKRHPGSSW